MTNPEICQNGEALRSGTSAASPFLAFLRRIRWHVARGPASFSPLRFLHLKLKSSTRHKDGVVEQFPPLNLQPGEWVEVKGEEEIQSTLEDGQTHKGLSFMLGMHSMCNKRFRVLRRVERIVLEGSPGPQRTRKIKNTVLLEHAMCDGAGSCDRSCFYLWREAWLRRVPAPPERRQHE